MKVLVTGANGFIGRALVRRMLDEGDLEVVCAVRSQTDSVLKWGVNAVVADIGSSFSCLGVLDRVDVVVHLAGRAHKLQDDALDPLAEFRRINTYGTLELARQAILAGARRFVFLSSIGVNGAHTGEVPYRPDDIPAPHSHYAVSKYEAEIGLRDLAASSGIEVVVVRPPLVYGAGAPGNFGRLLDAVARGVPFPLGAVTNNRRSFVALDNLVDLILRCVHHPAAANQTFLVSDGEDLSTAELLRRMGLAFGKSVRLLPVPPALLRWVGGALGKEDALQRLLGNLQVDIGKTSALLAWQPPLNVDQGLQRAVQREGYEASI